MSFIFFFNFCSYTRVRLYDPYRINYHDCARVEKHSAILTKQGDCTFSLEAENLHSGNLIVITRRYYSVDRFTVDD